MRTYQPLRALPLCLLASLFILAIPLYGASSVDEVARNAETLATEVASNITLGELIVWLSLGLLVGTILGPLATKSARGFGTAGNLILGLLGALLGGLLFDGLGIQLGLGSFEVNYDAFLAAAVGAAFLVAVVMLIKSKLKPAPVPKKN